MKSLLVFITLFIATGFTDHLKVKDEIYAGQLVIKGPCGQRVVSIISPINNLKVQENWEDPVTGELYKNVFSVRNFCELSSLEEGSTFFFRFIKMKMSVCPTCLLFRPVPGPDGAIILVSKDSVDFFRRIKSTENL